MTIRHLRIFLAVWESGCNTTRAAASLRLSQPAVSLAIRELEEYYGVALFDRLGRRLRITPAGERFQGYACQILSLFDDMEKSIKNWDYAGILRVGASITIGSRFLPRYVKEFSRLCPGIEIRAVVEPSDALEEKLLDNRLDLALVEGVPHSPSLRAEEYMEDRLAVIVPAEGAFAPGQVLSLEDFRRQRFLLRERGSGTRDVFDRVTEAAGFSVSPLWEAMSTTALVNAVAEGLGIAVLPERLVAQAVREGRVLQVTVQGLDFRRKFSILYHREKHFTAAAGAFVRLCREGVPEIPPEAAGGLY